MYNLPEDINELEYAVTYKQHGKYIVYFFIHLDKLISFNLLKSEYNINIYHFKDKNIFGEDYSVDELKYENYKYLISEIDNFLSINKGEILTNTDIVKKIIEAKYLNSIRKLKIKKLLC